MVAIAPFRAVLPGHRSPEAPALYWLEAQGPQGSCKGLLAWLATEGLPPGVAAGLDGEGPAVLRYEDPRGWVEEILSSNAFTAAARLHEADGEQVVWRIDRPEAVGEVVAQFEDRAVALLRPAPVPGDGRPAAPAPAGLAFLVRGGGWVPRRPGGHLAVPEGEPVPQAWSGAAGPKQWRKPPGI